MDARAVRDAVYSILSPRLRTDELSSTEAQGIEDEINGQVMHLRRRRAHDCSLALSLSLCGAPVLLVM